MTWFYCNKYKKQCCSIQNSSALTSVDKDVEHLELTLLVGMQNIQPLWKMVWQFLSHIISPSSSSPRYLLKRNKNLSTYGLVLEYS